VTWGGWLLVALGGAAGAVLRYLAGHLGDTPRQVPWGTVAVNLVGSFVLGVVVSAGTDGLGYDLAGLGFCGALTTYSSFAVQVHERGARLGAVTVLVTAPPALLLYALGHGLATLGG
jgi:CrcB protein